jgi:uncharacterized membrane protein
MGTSTRILSAASFWFVLSIGACSNDSDSHEESEGVATQSTCPDSAPTYDSFGRDFMQSYCTGCHSSARRGADRNDAPVGHDFDTLEGVLAVAEHIDEYAAAGPAGVNTAMPLSSPSPSDEERRRLGEWLACETAQGAGGDAGSHD